MTHILVFGASKGIGRAVTKQALESGYRVQAVARRGGINQEPDLEHIAGDACDPSAIVASLVESTSSSRPSAFPPGLG